MIPPALLTDPTVRAEYDLVTKAITAARAAGYTDPVSDTEAEAEEHRRRVAVQGRAYEHLRSIFPTIELGSNERLVLLGQEWSPIELSPKSYWLFEYPARLPSMMVHDLTTLGCWFLQHSSTHGPQG